MVAFLMGLDRRRLLGHGAGGVGFRNPHWSSDYGWTTAWSWMYSVDMATESGRLGFTCSLNHASCWAWLSQTSPTPNPPAVGYAMWMMKPGCFLTSSWSPGAIWS